MCVIQGTFYAWDRLPVLFGFVRESLVDGWQPFELIAPGGLKLQESEDVALAESNLVGPLDSFTSHLEEAKQSIFVATMCLGFTVLQNTFY